MGSDYESSEGEGDDNDYYSSEEDDNVILVDLKEMLQFSESEQESNDHSSDNEDLDSSVIESKSQMSSHKLTLNDPVRIRQAAEKDLPFNALRFLGEALKSIKNGSFD